MQSVVCEWERLELSRGLFGFVRDVSVGGWDADWLLGGRPEPGVVVDGTLVTTAIEKLLVIDLLTVWLLGKGQVHRPNEEILRAVGVDFPLFIRDVFELVPHEFIWLERWANSHRDFTQWEERSSTSHDDVEKERDVSPRH